LFPAAGNLLSVAHPGASPRAGIRTAIYPKWVLATVTIASTSGATSTIVSVASRRVVSKVEVDRVVHHVPPRRVASLIVRHHVVAHWHPVPAPHLTLAVVTHPVKVVTPALMV